jgi:hypothetical protein
MSTYLSSLKYPTRPGFETEKNHKGSLGRAPIPPNDRVFGIGFKGAFFLLLLYCSTSTEHRG